MPCLKHKTRGPHQDPTWKETQASVASGSGTAASTTFKRRKANLLHVAAASSSSVLDSEPSALRLPPAFGLPGCVVFSCDSYCGQLPGTDCMALAGMPCLQDPNVCRHLVLGLASGNVSFVERRRTGLMASRSWHLLYGVGVLMTCIGAGSSWRYDAWQGTTPTGVLSGRCMARHHSYWGAFRAEEVDFCSPRLCWMRYALGCT